MWLGVREIISLYFSRFIISEPYPVQTIKNARKVIAHAPVKSQFPFFDQRINKSAVKILFFGVNFLFYFFLLVIGISSKS